MEPRTLYELFDRVTSTNPDRLAYRYKQDGTWQDVTWSEQRDAVARISKGLLALGVKKGDRVAILSSTRLEWVRCDSALVNIGAVTVGIYHSSPGPDCAYIVEHSGAELMFVENVEQLKKVQACRSEMPCLRGIVLFDSATADPRTGVTGWIEFLAGGSKVPDSEIARCSWALEPDDLASLVYTSGTTGLPKGAMITHANLLFTARAAEECLGVDDSQSTLLFLPLAHVFARMIVYLCTRLGMSIAFAEDLSKIADNLQEIRPQFIVSVPRIYEKFHERIVGSAERAGGLRAALFRWAISTGLQAVRLRVRGERVPLWLRLRIAVADGLVLRKVRDVFGGQLVWCASGAAPLNPDINEFFLACGIQLVEGLGMTENTSLSNVNRAGNIRPGTVGPVVPGVEMKLAEDGEVLFRGDNLMAGYYRDPEATAEAIDGDGWLHSGDIGEIDGDGFLRITDRKKDLIVTAGGKNVAPQKIERILRTSRFISQVVAYGDRRKFISALISLDEENIRRWAKENAIENSIPFEKLAGLPAVRELIDSEVCERNRELASFESVKKFCILPRDLGIDTGELTPTLKPRRKVIYQKYRSLLDEMYRG